MDLVLLHNQRFHRFFFKDIFKYVWHYFLYERCLKYQKKASALCPANRGAFWTFVIIYYCNLWYPVISVRKWNVCYFFLIFCYEMKCLPSLKIYIPLFFSHEYYSCHISWLKYQGSIWTTLYTKKVPNIEVCNFINAPLRLLPIKQVIEVLY